MGSGNGFYSAKEIRSSFLLVPGLGRELMPRSMKGSIGFEQGNNQRATTAKSAVIKVNNNIAAIIKRSMAAKIFSLFLMIFAAVVVADPEPLQDLCVADIASGLKVNGFACKDPETVTAEDFWSNMLGYPASTNNSNGVGVAAANVLKVAGINTLGISLGRIDYAVNAVNPPHLHPRASEIVYVIEGDLEVGFVTTNNSLIAKQLKKGDLFVFPKALIHYQKNIGKTPAAVIAAFDSQFPGTQSIINTLFASKPAITPDVLAKSFKVNTAVVEDIKCKLAPKI